MHEPDLITQLGGPKYVGERVGAEETAVCNWRTRGVAWKHRVAVAALAKEKGVKLPENFLPSLADAGAADGSKAA